MPIKREVLSLKKKVASDVKNSSLRESPKSVKDFEEFCHINYLNSLQHLIHILSEAVSISWKFQFWRERERERERDFSDLTYITQY